MNRRTFIAMLAGGVLAAPFAAEPQPPGKVKRIGSVCAERDPRIIDAFEERLHEFGYMVGRDIAFDYRCRGGTSEQLQAGARDLVALPVDVLVA